MRREKELLRVHCRLDDGTLIVEFPRRLANHDPVTKRALGDAVAKAVIRVFNRGGRA
jgi:hypothetical protein